MYSISLISNLKLIGADSWYIVFFNNLLLSGIIIIPVKLK
jgi:hypothetical protein